MAKSKFTKSEKQAFGIGKQLKLSEKTIYSNLSKKQKESFVNGKKSALKQKEVE